MKASAQSKLNDLDLPDDFELSQDFAACFKAIEESHKNIYVTGEAGTGKSTFLKYFRLNTKKKVVVLAPTGIAAINVSGQTVHSFFRLPHQFIQKEHIKKVYGGERIFSNLDILIIDEVSMMRADLMDAVDHSLRFNRGRMLEPFGGVQILLIGDLFQLPPIIDKGLAPHYTGFYETPYFFSAKVFSESAFYHYHFGKIYRQSDPHFTSLLNKIRHGELTAEDLKILNARVGSSENDLKINGYVTLTTTNAAAQTINELKLSELTGPEYEFEAEITGTFEESAYPTETKFRLKSGARVLMIKNDPDKRWVNGSLGEVVAVSKFSVQVKIGKKFYDVAPVIWERMRYGFDEQNGNIIQEVTGSFEQYPMKLAWAITIHKSQGLTFDQVAVDLGRGAFTHGQVYVALSRCRTFENLILKRPVYARDIIFDSQIELLGNRFQPLLPESASCLSDEARLIQAAE